MCDDRANDRLGVHAGAKTFAVQSDTELLPVLPLLSRRSDVVQVEDVRVGQDACFAAPPGADLLRGTGGERDQFRRRRHQHVELRIVLVAFRVVGIAQIVHGEHQRAPRLVQCVDQFLQLFR